MDVGPTRPAPGWYRDPADPGRLRWWDGSAWTSAVVHEDPTVDEDRTVGHDPAGVAEPPPGRELAQDHWHDGQALWEQSLLVYHPHSRPTIAEFSIFDGARRQIASVVRQGAAGLGSSVAAVSGPFGGDLQFRSWDGHVLLQARLSRGVRGVAAYVAGADGEPLGLIDVTRGFTTPEIWVRAPDASNLARLLATPGMFHRQYRALDQGGTELARIDASNTVLSMGPSTLRLPARHPEPLHSLLLATPIVIGNMGAAS